MQGGGFIGNAVQGEQVDAAGEVAFGIADGFGQALGGFAGGGGHADF